jgi:hypothetical protein
MQVFKDSYRPDVTAVTAYAGAQKEKTSIATRTTRQRAAKARTISQRFQIYLTRLCNGKFAAWSLPKTQ